MESRQDVKVEAEFREERRKGIGGSDAPVILGLSPWKSPLQLYAEKVGILGEPDLDEVERVQWGKRLEPFVVDAYKETTGREVIPWPALSKHLEHPFLIGHVDRLVEAPDKPGRGVLEVKTTSAYRAKDWQDEPPLAYQVQLQHYLAVTGAEWGSLAVLIGGQNFRWMDVQRNDTFIAAMILKEVEFWGRVERRDPPHPAAFDASTLRALYPAETEEEAIALPPESVEWDRELAEVKSNIKGLSERKDELENRIKSAIGTRAVGFLPDGSGRYSWKSQTRSAYSVPESQARILRRLK